MESRNITLTLKKAKEWYNSNSTDLKEIALQAYTENELIAPKFTNIKTFNDACEALGISYTDINRMFNGYYGVNIFNVTPASIASIELNIIRQALNKGYKMELTKNTVYYPYIPFVTKENTYYNSELKKGNIVEVAKFKANGKVYRLLGGCDSYSGYAGLGYFNSNTGIATSFADVGFLGCASGEIAKHMSKYFAREIFEAMYSDFIDFEWI